MMAKNEVVARLRAINPDNVITSVLFFLKGEFTSDPKKLHTGFRKLREQGKYRELLELFTFVNAFPFPYSPLLERVLHRIQEAKLLSARNPDFVMYEMTERAKRTIRSGILSKFSKEQQAKLREMASELNQLCEENTSVS